MKPSTEAVPMKTEVSDQLLRATPAGAGAFITTMTLNEWVAVATGVYILIQAVYLLRKWYREEKAWNARHKRKPKEAA
jgi:hypothetical protein